MHENGSQKLEDLIQEGWDHLDAGEYEEAEAIATKLIASQASAGYRLQAMCQIADDDWEAARESLEAGVSRFPDDWELHLMLGNYLSENEEYDAALASFERALACPGVQPDWIAVNKAVIYSKIGAYEQALAICAQIDNPDLKLQVLEVEFRVMSETERYDEILATAEQRLEEVPEVDEEGAAVILSKVLYYIALASWRTDGPEAETLEYLWSSIDYDRSNVYALWLLREVRGEYSESAKTFTLLVQGNFALPEEEEEESDEAGEAFFTSYKVVADSLEEAYEMIVEFESEEVDTDSMEIMQYEEAPAEPESLKGIHEVGALGFLG